MLNGAIVFIHWAAMLISYPTILAGRSVIYPFKDLREMYMHETYFKFYTLPESAMWSSFKDSDDELWQNIHRDMFDPNTEWFDQYMGSTSKQVEWLLLDISHSLYGNFYKFK